MFICVSLCVCLERHRGRTKYDGYVYEAQQTQLCVCIWRATASPGITRCMRYERGCVTK